MSEHPTPTVLLGITGCVAAYKACELARLLMREGCRVKTVMTDNATRFVGPATLRALTGEPVAVSLWDEPSARIHHISLAEEADVFVIAPATANVIAKLASGRADDLLTTVALATQAPLVIAPAMNVHMWRAEPTCANVAALDGRGTTIVGPDIGDLACGDTGEGRLAPVEDIAREVLSLARTSSDLLGVNVLVTAGPTREPLDPIRFLSNASSGRTGYAIAQEASRRGASVTLVSGPTALPDPFGVKTVRVSSALEMAAAVNEEYHAADVVIATAAVSDYRPQASSPVKIKKSESDSILTFVRNPDILAALGARKHGRLLVGFAAETSDPVGYARVKLAEKNLDLVVANDVSDPALGFGSRSNHVWLVDTNGSEELPLMAKTEIARAVWDRLACDARRARENRMKG